MEEKNNNVKIEKTEDTSLSVRNYGEELLSVIRNPSYSNEEIADILADYHESDIADVLPELTDEERERLLKILDLNKVSDIFSYLDNPDEVIDTLPTEKVADIIENMDADDAVDVLDELEEDKKQEIIKLLDDDAKEDINLITSYDEDRVGSKMTTNFVYVEYTDSIKHAMTSVLAQAKENDNISTIYAVDDKNVYYGAIQLRDLVIARANQPLEDIIATSYPFLYATESIDKCLEDLKTYEEDSIPVLDENKKLIGVITSSDVVKAVDDEIQEDYAKLAGLTEAEDLKEPLWKSFKKRAPWLLALLFLGLLVSSVTGIFENVIAALPFIVFYQSLILDMGGNVGTQCLAVAIRMISKDGETTKEKFKYIRKEFLIGVLNGVILGVLSVLIIGGYMAVIKHFGVAKSFHVSACIGGALAIAILISSLTGTVIPIILKKLKIDPAAASGPLITTINDLVCVITYYGFAWLFLM